MTPGTLGEIIAAWRAVLPASLPLLVVGALGGAALVRHRPPGWAVPGAALLVGVALAFGQRALVDDAFITLRYADHVLRGLGPVWNEGQRVEGITNFGWMALEVALGGVGLRLEHAALLLSFVGYLALVGVTGVVERSLTATDRWPPLATGLVAVQVVVTAFATTGLESDAAAACVLLGAWAVHRERPLGAGLAFAVAGLLRMDHLLGAATAGLWLLVRHRALGSADRRALAGFALGLTPWALVQAAKVQYYGVWLPNTFWAKSADGWYLSQGLVYELVFWLGTGFWWLWPASLAWPILAEGRERAFASWALLFSAVWHLYVLKVGGDFMVGRFLVPIVPLVLLAAVRVGALLGRSSTVTGVVAAAAVGATLRGTCLVPPGRLMWWLADENTIYPLVSVIPPVVGHAGFDQGHRFRELFTDRGLRPVLATSGIGMVGFYSGLEVVDLVGLTEPEVAALEVVERGRPGHEKKAPASWLDARGVDFVRARPAPAEWDPVQRLDFGPLSEGWWVWRHDPELAAAIEAVSPEVRVLRPEAWIRVRAARGEGGDRRSAKALVRSLDHYYFEPTGDLETRRLLLERIDQRWPPGSP